jgi:hypothetical protein
VRIVEHYAGGPHKLLRVEADGCAVNIIIDLHDPSGGRNTAIEVEPRLPDQDGQVWEADGRTTVIVHCRGAQVMSGDLPLRGHELPSRGLRSSAGVDHD